MLVRAVVAVSVFFMRRYSDEIVRAAVEMRLGG